VGAVVAGFLVVPEREPDRALRLHAGTTEDAGQLHDQRRTRTIVIRGLAETAPIHVRADDVHFVGARAADFRAIHLFARTGSRRLRVEGAKRGIGLGDGIVIGGRRPRHAAQSRTARARTEFPAGDFRTGGRSSALLGLWRRYIVGVPDALGVRAAIALELRFDPVDRCPVSVGALLPVAELGQALDGGLVFLQIEPRDQRFGVVGRGALRLRG